MQNNALALAALVVKSSKQAAPAFLMVASRHGRGEPELMLKDEGPITWQGEDGVAEFLCLPDDLEIEVMRVIRTSGLLVFDASEVARDGEHVKPVTLLKI